MLTIRNGGENICTIVSPDEEPLVRATRSSFLFTRGVKVGEAFRVRARLEAGAGQPARS